MVALVAFVFCSGFGSGERLFAPSADLWERWQVHNPRNGEEINHAPWDSFLKNYVVAGPAGITLVRYGAVTEAHRQQLDRYITYLTSLKITGYGRQEQFAYWINLYNALTVKVVLDHYPVKSIRDIDISPGFFSDGPWGKKLVVVEGENLSLNDIEHRILRPIWRDSRIHYAVNCASIGCPNLQKNAYRGASVEAMLDAGARAYINSPRGVAITGSEITVSKIYDWFIDDFGGDEKSVLAHIASYAKPALRQQLVDIGKIEGVDYDWALNGTEK
jgi:hypothetical protein